MKKNAPTENVGPGGMVSFRADGVTLSQLKAIAAKDERKLADTVRRIVMRWLALPDRVKK